VRVFGFCPLPSGGRLRLVADCIPVGGASSDGGGTMRTVIPGLALVGHCTWMVWPFQREISVSNIRLIESNNTRKLTI
jgi:hypothetical protein